MFSQDSGYHGIGYQPIPWENTYCRCWRLIQQILTRWRASNGKIRSDWSQWKLLDLWVWLRRWAWGWPIGAAPLQMFSAWSQREARRPQERRLLEALPLLWMTHHPPAQLNTFSCTAMPFWDNAEQVTVTSKISHMSPRVLVRVHARDGEQLHRFVEEALNSKLGTHAWRGSRSVGMPNLMRFEVKRSRKMPLLGSPHCMCSRIALALMSYLKSMKIVGMKALSTKLLTKLVRDRLASCSPEPNQPEAASVSRFARRALPSSANCTIMACEQIFVRHSALDSSLKACANRQEETSLDQNLRHGHQWSMASNLDLNAELQDACLALLKPAQKMTCCTANAEACRIFYSLKETAGKCGTPSWWSYRCGEQDMHCPAAQTWLHGPIAPGHPLPILSCSVPS